MHILYIQPGSGGSFYCQNCLRDISVCDALRKAGHEVTMLPLYLPATAHAPAPEDSPVFYSAVTLYLRHKYSWMRKLPRGWFRPLDTWPVLKLAAHFAGSTDASGLEDLTLSMLKGMEGTQAEELAMLAEWIEALPGEERPDVIVLSNALLAGLAERLKQAAKCPVVCWLQDEHVWTDAMHDSLRQAVIRAMREDAVHIDRFIAVSVYYRKRMMELLNLSSEKVEVVYPSVNVEEYKRAELIEAPRRIGFLSRLADTEGFATIVDAFIELRTDSRFKDVRLSATGGASPDKKYMKRQLNKLRKAGLEKDCEISPTLFIEDRKGFLSDLTILSVPGGDIPEAFGYYAIEAMAAGVPVVLPEHGAFPEFVNEESGGILLKDISALKLSGCWADLLSKPEELRVLAECAFNTVQSRFDEKQMAKRVIELLSALQFG